jgi:hypothetical protein
MAARESDGLAPCEETFVSIEAMCVPPGTAPELVPA